MLVPLVGSGSDYSRKATLGAHRNVTVDYPLFTGPALAYTGVAGPAAEESGSFPPSALFGPSENRVGIYRLYGRVEAFTHGALVIGWSK